MAYTTFRPSADGSLVINESAGRRTAEEISQHAKRLMKKTLERAARSGVEEAFGNAIVENRNQPGFSYQTMIEGIRARGLSETITTTSVYSSLDVATQQDVFDDYAAYPAIYESIAEIQQSNSDEELYPEDWTDDLPAQVSELEEAPQARISGIEYRIRNHTYARMLSISKDAFDNDQRGRIKRRASQFAQNYKKVIDRTFIYTMFRQLTTSNTFMPSTNILGQNSIVGSTAGPITPQRLQDAYTLSAFIADPYGEYITVNLDTLVCDKFDEMNARRFLTAMYSPTQFGSSSTGYNADTSPGPFTENILRGLLGIAASPYVKASRTQLGGSGLPALIMEAKRGQVVQLRQDLQVTMENPDSGDSFKQRSYNWQGVLKFGTGNRNPRLFIVIN